MGVVIEHLSDSDTSSDEDRDDVESAAECEKKIGDFLSPSRKATSSRNSSRGPSSRSRRPQATEKEMVKEREFPSHGANFQAIVPPIAVDLDRAKYEENASIHTGSRRVWSGLSAAPVAPSNPLSPVIAHNSTARTVPATPSEATQCNDVISSQTTSDEQDIPYYWSQESLSHCHTVPSNGSQTASLTLGTGSDKGFEALVDRTLYEAMLAQYLPGMVVSYIRGSEGEGKAVGAEAASLGSIKLKDEREKEKEKEKEREKSEDHMHASRSSRRISMVSDAAVKWTRFGCVIKAPFYPPLPSPINPAVPPTSDTPGCSAASGTDTEAPSSSLVSTSTPLSTAHEPQRQLYPRQPMVTLYTGVADEVQYISVLLSSIISLESWVLGLESRICCPTHCTADIPSILHADMYCTIQRFYLE